jgi:lipopolysaccharide transport system ATP-binding protein
MSNFAIRLENISKEYHIGGPQASYSTLREAIVDSAKAPFRRTRNILRGHATGAAELHKSFWALRDVSFDINHGDVVGLIGRNGAGKSTLLKILSRITVPTEGQAILKGRVGSLLEVGTGFHPELTGRENVFLNGAILGMKRSEIVSKFDEIVAFSEVEDFIDTPVKHYSSGMRVRLAFAVAAHLDPEVLLVDEVLAVGDIRFQRKCLNKMQDVGKHGRTVIFVSHNMSSITRLCERAVLLESGQVIADGPADKVVSSYMQTGLGTSAARRWDDINLAPGGKIIKLRGVRVCNEEGEATDAMDIRKPVFIEMEYDVLQPNYILLPHFRIRNEEGLNLFTANDLDPEWRGKRRPVGRYISRTKIPGNFMAEGTISVQTLLMTLEPVILEVNETDSVAFQVIDSIEGDSVRGDYGGRMPGLLRPMLEWTTEYKPNGDS